MNKKFVSKIKAVLSLGILALNVSLFAEFRGPVAAESGPFRYFFEEPSDSGSFRWWSSCYTKWAAKSFTEKHGRNLTDFPTLLFGKSDFRLCHILPDCLADLTYENYHPLLRTSRLRLNADYSETAVIFGFKFDYPIYTQKDSSSRISIEVSIPFKRTRVTKYDNEGAKLGAQLQDVMAIQSMRLEGSDALFGATAQDQDPANWLSNSDVITMRLDFLEALLQETKNRASFVDYVSPVDPNAAHLSGQRAVKAGSSVVSFNNEELNSTGAIPGIKNSDDTDPVYGQLKFMMIYVPEGQIPNFVRNFSVPTKDSSSYRELPPDANIANAPNHFYFKAVDGSDPYYKNLADNAPNKSVEQRILDQDHKASVWAIPIAYASVAADGVTPDKPYQLFSGSPLATAKLLAQTTNGNEYTWLGRAGMNFQSFTEDSIGDISGRICYETNMANFFAFAAGLEVTAPTGGKAKYKNNPYQVYPGNGGHWALGPCGYVAFNFSDYVNMKAFATYRWVLNELEERCAVFKNSQVKNVGPKVEADVKWQDFIGRIDLNVTHPDTASITGSVGYEFYYKRREVIKYSKPEMQSWLGRKYNTEFSTTLGLPNAPLLAAPAKLDEEAASKNTNAISHKLRFEASYLLSRWLEFYWGGAWAFAGRNSLAEIEGHAGFHIAF